ncbi:hypothetical protein HYQ46_003123 [Verticillium longisporum]|nr:hypothetical protein HYQ46_003123 [Verticillium longisporum]
MVLPLSAVDMGGGNPWFENARAMIGRQTRIRVGCTSQPSEARDEIGRNQRGRRCDSDMILPGGGSDGQGRDAELATQDSWREECLRERALVLTAGGA